MIIPIIVISEVLSMFFAWINFIIICCVFKKNVVNTKEFKYFSIQKNSSYIPEYFWILFFKYGIHFLKRLHEYLIGLIKEWSVVKKCCMYWKVFHNLCFMHDLCFFFYNADAVKKYFNIVINRNALGLRKFRLTIDN